MDRLTPEALHTLVEAPALARLSARTHDADVLATLQAWFGGIGTEGEVARPFARPPAADLGTTYILFAGKSPSLAALRARLRPVAGISIVSRGKALAIRDATAPGPEISVACVQANDVVREAIERASPALARRIGAATGRIRISYPAEQRRTLQALIDRVATALARGTKGAIYDASDARFAGVRKR
jgi:hypothetical protein